VFFGLYGIIDLGIVEEQEIERVVLAFLRGKVCAIQLRAKEKSARAIFEVATLIKQLIKGRVPFIINDRIDMVMVVDADGVHLGQEDIPPDRARRVLGQKIIGVSTHTLSEALSALKDGADYIGFGPIFPTRTKRYHGDPRGLHRLKEVVQKVPLPIVAIGGITLENAKDVIRTGVSAIAAISAILQRKDIEIAVKKFGDLFSEDQSFTCL
jgi:thiamine-phosphate pyrophosphorylase